MLDGLSARADEYGTYLVDSEVSQARELDESSTHHRRQLLMVSQAAPDQDPLVVVERVCQVSSLLRLPPVPKDNALRPLIPDRGRTGTSVSFVGDEVPTEIECVLGERPHLRVREISEVLPPSIRNPSCTVGPFGDHWRKRFHGKTANSELVRDRQEPASQQPMGDASLLTVVELVHHHNGGLLERQDEQFFGRKPRPHRHVEEHYTNKTVSQCATCEMACIMPATSRAPSPCASRYARPVSLLSWGLRAGLRARRALACQALERPPGVDAGESFARKPITR